MAEIGNWGKQVTFFVNSQKILTFRNFKRTVSGRWSEHNIIGQKPKMEFAGPEADENSMEIVLSAENGVRPRAIIETLEKAIETGRVEYLYIGGKKIGSNKLYIQSMSETWDEIWNKGELVKATLQITFSEYV